MIRIKVVILALFSYCLAGATVQQYDIRHFNPEAGLNGTYIYTTIQGPNGYKWVGTDYGLTRFDGLKFELMDANDSTKKNFASSAFTHNGKIYFGYFNGTIKVFDGKGFNVIREELYEQSPITSIFKSQNHLIAVSQNNGLFRILDDTLEVYEPAELKYKKVNFAKPFKELILVGTNEGLLAYKFNDSNRLVYAGSISGLNFMSIQSLERNKAKENSFWVGTDYGLYHLDMDIEGAGISGTVEKAGFLEKESISALRETGNLDLWVGTKYNGLVKINFNRDNTKSIQFTFLNKKHNFPGDFISTINMDEDESIWVGTIGDGLVQVAKKGLIYYSFEDFRTRSVNSISGNSHHEFFFGTDVGLIKGYYTGTVDSINFELIKDKKSRGNITAIYVDKDDRIYYCVEDVGLFTADSDLSNIEQINFDYGGGKLMIRQIIKSPDGNLWLSLTQKGVFELDPKGKLLNNYSTSTGFYHNEIYHIHFDRKGNTWFASHGAGLAVMRSNGTILYLTKDGLFPSHDVNDISEDEYGNLWIGTHGDGIYEYKDEEFIRFSTKEGLLNDFCSAVISDKSNHVWATHRTGLSRVDEFTDAVSTIQKKDGLVVAEFIHNSIFTDQDHNIWIGNRNGVTFLSTPDELFESKIIEPIISDVKVGYDVLDLWQYSSDSVSGSRVPKNIEFTHDLNNLTFEYIAINLRNPAANLYQYKLEGLEENWSPITKNGQVTYNNLGAGTYTFHVRQSDNPNHWGENISSVNIRIKRAWWETWWAILLFLLCGFGLVYGFIKWRTDRLNIRLKEKQRLISITESQNKRLKEFSFITSHNTRSSVSNIRGLITALESDPGNQDFIKMLKNSSDRLNGTIRHINELLNFENDRESLNKVSCNVKESIDRVLKSNEEEIRKHGAKVITEIPADISVNGVPTYFESALNNLISNALKFGITEDSKEITLSAESLDDEVMVKIQDHGVGIDLNRFGKKLFSLGSRFHPEISEGDGLGMFISKNQIEGMGGKVEIASKEGEGTTIYIYLKKPNHEDSGGLADAP
ncbi:Signal transduction histidine kinase [Ekhidna lutea]|uniref:histidine kinase n=1 Tax=Ekhidna lutea TaxID=447679 RepID=A0A239KZR2_EKHLU|nr:sensor histidine kinase [Ekhidna lutea]SNT23827.1 Signal transduction histidine kinase [Ekhidna lutea]